MKKILSLIILIFSCDSLEDKFGVGESQQNFFYYDFLAYGWSQIFENNPELALDYFDQSLNIPNIQYYNSSFVGMGWAKTYQAHGLLNSDLCIDNSLDCTDDVDIARQEAKCFFYQSTLNNDVDLSLLSSSQILNQCDDDMIELYDQLDIINFNLDSAVSYYANSCAEDEQGNVEYINCFENFILDMQVAHLYLEYISYLKSISDDNGEDIATSQIIDLFQLFLQKYPTYDIMSDKSSYNFNYSLNYKNIASTLVTLYLNVGDYDNACSFANTYELCENVDCNSGNILDLIDCIETSNLSDF